MKIFGKHFNTSKLSYINPKVKLGNTHIERGLFALKNIRKGEIISITAGLIVSEKIFRKLPNNIRSYGYFVENGYFQVPFTSKLSADWFMNHSCNPNVGGKGTRFTIYALRKIKKGEEILYDYSKDYSEWKYHPFRKFKCVCGAKNCKLVVRY